MRRTIDSREQSCHPARWAAKERSDVDVRNNASRQSCAPGLLPMVGQTHLFHEPKSQARYWAKIFRFFEETLGAR
jgi:hypothetical protein